MREPERVDAMDLLQGLHVFDDVIDVRTPSEFLLDHLPDAINLPVLGDAERTEIGTLNAKHSAFESRRRGAALVTANIAGLLAGPLADRPPQWRPLVYCWRGGNRSGALATVLARIGWRATVLEGGYRAYRRAVVAALSELPARMRFVVIAGRTGTGKSLLLAAMRRRGAQVLELEELACHRGSVLGLEPGSNQPSQKRFENLLHQTLRRMDLERPVYVESESRKIGQIQVPEALIVRMRASPCLVIDADLPTRTALLIREYAHFLGDPDPLAERLASLASIHGQARVDQWLRLVADRQWQPLVTQLLELHYDPAYDRSMRRNFALLDQAPRLALALVGPDHENVVAQIDAAIDSCAETAIVAGEKLSFAVTQFAPGEARPSNAP